jgi:hypothetical protein
MLRQQGAVIVNPADIPSVVDTSAASNFLNWNHSTDNAKGVMPIVGRVWHGMKRDFNAWLHRLGPRRR